MLLPFARELWRELHPRAPEQLPLFAPLEAETSPAGSAAWLWETSRAG